MAEDCCGKHNASYTHPYIRAPVKYYMPTAYREILVWCRFSFILYIYDASPCKNKMYEKFYIRQGDLSHGNVEIERWRCTGISSLWAPFQTPVDPSLHVGPAAVKDPNEAVRNALQGISKAKRELCLVNARTQGIDRRVYFTTRQLCAYSSFFEALERRNETSERELPGRIQQQAKSC